MTSNAPKPVDYRRVLKYFMAKNDEKMISEVDKLLSKHKGKEAKLMLLLAKKYDCSNPLNRIFVDRVSEDRFDDDDYLALTTLYLSVFYPQDVDQAEALCSTYKGKEDELFKKLSSNFHAINPLKMKKKKTDGSICSKAIDYNEVLTAFYKEHDAEKVADVEDVLSKCKGKEAILFSVFALKYNTSNALNVVFEDRLKDTECKDNLTLLKLYLSVFHPTCTPDAKSMLSKYQGKEEDLFAKLGKKFCACNPLEICANLGKTLLGSLVEVSESQEDQTNPTVIQDSYVSPKRNARVTRIAQSPAFNENAVNTPHRNKDAASSKGGQTIQRRRLAFGDISNRKAAGGVGGGKSGVVLKQTTSNNTTQGSLKPGNSKVLFEE